MIIRVNEKEYEVPFDPLVISLGKYIQYQNEYGKDISKRLEEVIKEPDSERKAIKLDNLLDEEAISWFSFWTGINLFQAKQLPGMNSLIGNYKTLRYLLKFNEEEDSNFPMSVKWNGENWKIQDFKINPASEMSFNEIVTSKEVMHQLFELGMGKIESLTYLCAVFFRKDGESFDDSMIYENSTRLQLINEIPLRYAMNVSLFLSLCVDTWKRIFLSSEREVA